ncbi:uncharacterized protein [Musca autumnalis]|uniref:uncharacterized protein n=1 Tax=Musca autumnalis TaxID=221902 RepID=UPI003CF5C545
MVVSKRCKVCTIIEADNMPLAGEYFGRPIPEIIEKLCGLELDPRKLTDVLICQQCAIQLVHAESVVNKLRKCMIRLTKPAKPKAPKTPSKSAVVTKAKETSTSPTKKKKETQTPSTLKEDADQGSVFKKFTDETTAVKDTNDESFSKINKKKSKDAKRKLEDTLTNGLETDTPTKTTEQENENGDCGELALKEKAKKRVKLDSTSIVNSSLLDETAGDADISVHSSTKILNCVLCEKKFDQKSLLREHIETSHMGEKLKECPNCFMEFRSVQKYQSHLFSEKCKGTLLPCQFQNCNRRFKNVHKMEIHMREKHLSPNGLDGE